MIFFMLDLGKSKAPNAIEHSLHVLNSNGVAQDIMICAFAGFGRRRIVVAPALAGAWIAGDSVNNGPNAAYRKAVIVQDGYRCAQRY